MRTGRLFFINPFEIRPPQAHLPLSAELIGAHSDSILIHLTFKYYLARFIDSGIMDARQILTWRNIDDLPDRARIFLKRMILPPKTVELVIEAQLRGIDLDKILQEMLYSKPEN